MREGDRVVTPEGKHGVVTRTQVFKEWDAVRMRERRRAVAFVNLDNGGRWTDSASVLRHEQEDER